MQIYLPLAGIRENRVSVVDFLEFLRLFRVSIQVFVGMVDQGEFPENWFFKLRTKFSPNG